MIVYDDFGRVSDRSSGFAENPGNHGEYERIIYYLHCIFDVAVHGAYFDCIASGRKDQKFNAEHGYYGKRIKGYAA